MTEDGATLDYDAIWASIVASPLHGAYVTEVYWLAANVVRRAREVFQSARTPSKPTESYIKVDHELTTTLTTLVDEAVRLKAMLTDRPRDKKRQSQTQHEIQVRRARWIRDELLKDVKLKTILESGVRNTLEHFDEYLDDVAIRCREAVIPRPTMIPLDIAVGYRKTLVRFHVGGKQAHVENLRVYIASEKVFVNAGREISIRALHDEARRIVKRLEPLLPKYGSDPEEGGSSVFVLTDESFPPMTCGLNDESDEKSELEGILSEQQEDDPFHNGFLDCRVLQLPDPASTHSRSLRRLIPRVAIWPSRPSSECIPERKNGEPSPDLAGTPVHVCVSVRGERLRDRAELARQVWRRGRPCRDRRKTRSDEIRNPFQEWHPTARYFEKWKNCSISMRLERRAIVFACSHNATRSSLRVSGTLSEARSGSTDPTSMKTT